MHACTHAYRHDHDFVFKLAIVALSELLIALWVVAIVSMPRIDGINPRARYAPEIKRWLLRVLMATDWVSRHELMSGIKRRNPDFASDIERRMPPDLLLNGTLTGLPVDRRRVIVLKDKVRKRRSTLSNVNNGIRRYFPVRS